MYVIIQRYTYTITHVNKPYVNMCIISYMHATTRLSTACLYSIICAFTIVSAPTYVHHNKCTYTETRLPLHRQGRSATKASIETRWLHRRMQEGQGFSCWITLTCLSVDHKSKTADWMCRRRALQTGKIRVIYHWFSGSLVRCDGYELI